MALTDIQKAEETRQVQLEIRDRFPDILWPEPILEPIYYGRFDKTRVDSRKLMLDANTGVQFDIVSDRYDLIPHEIAAHNLLKSIPEEFGKPTIKISLWQDGARFRMEASFPEVGNFEVKPGDLVEPKVIQTNSLDRSTFYGTEFGATELVCSNGLVAFRKRSETARRHIYGAEDIDKLSTDMMGQMENFGEQVGIWQRWNEQRVQEITDIEVCLEALPFSETEKDKILLLPLMNYENKTLKRLVEDKTSTLWSLNSAVTQFAAHEVNSEQRKFDLERKIAEVLPRFSAVA